MYVLTNGRNYLMYDSNNKIVSTTNKSKAIKFGLKDKAINLLNNLPKNLKFLGYRLEEIECDTEQTEKVEPSLPKGFPTYQDILHKVEDFECWYQDLMSYQKQIASYLELCEGQQLDIEHAIEFKSCNACEGYKLYKMLHDIRNNRRSAKDALMILQILEETFGDSMDKTKASKRIQGLSTRTYRPRAILEVFQNNS